MVLTLVCCKKKTQESVPPTQAETGFQDPLRLIKEFRTNFHDSNYLFEKLLHEEDQNLIKKPYHYVEFWYKRLGLIRGHIEDRLAFENTKIYVEEEPKDVAGVLVFDVRCDVPHVERIYLQVPWVDDQGDTVRQEDAFHEVFNQLVTENRLPTVSRFVKIRMKQDRGRWWIWEDFKGLFMTARGLDMYHEHLEVLDVSSEWRHHENGYAIRGNLRNKGNRSVYRIHMILHFKDNTGKTVGAMEEQHLFGEHTLDPGYASEFGVFVGGEHDTEWYAQWNKKDVTVTIVSADALPVGMQLVRQNQPGGAQ